jgi:hypothetical protein
VIRLRALVWSLLISTATATGAPVVAGESAAANRENQLKAGYLLNFAKLVEWPAGALAETLTICVLGASGLYDVLAPGLDGKRIGSRALAAHKLTDGESRERCGVLYVDAAVPAVTRALPEKAAPALTVSDAKGFARNDGIIELFTENNRLRFIINLESAKRAGLRVNPSLLQLAATVYTEAPP